MVWRRSYVDALLGILAFSAVPVACVPSNESFNLYGYGTGIGGLAVFAQGNLAYIGHDSYIQQLSNNTNATVIKFTTGSDSSVWHASPNQTAEAAPFSNATLFVPGEGASSSQVGFLHGKAANSSVSSNNFLFYGDVAMHVNETGHWETHWCAEPTENKDVWALHWIPSAGSAAGNQVLLDLKTTPPTNATGATPPSVASDKTST